MILGVNKTGRTVTFLYLNHEILETKINDYECACGTLMQYFNEYDPPAETSYVDMKALYDAKAQSLVIVGKLLIVTSVFFLLA